jgi:hypothetical protein
MSDRQPKRPHQSSDDAPRCDSVLPLLALAHRKKHDLMTTAAFRKYNVSVWLLDNKGKPEYIAAHNRTIAELEEESERKDDSLAKVGFHAEVIAGEQIYRRQDVLRGETIVRQIFTERIPCSECRTLLANIPQFRNVPKYYYLLYQDQEWQRKQAGGDWGVFLMDCYRLRNT